MFSYARICVEVDLEKGFPESINLSIDGWSHLQTVDYEKIPFKCKYCHEYSHFSKSCPKKPEKPLSDNVASEGWNVASGKKTAKPQKQQNDMAKNTFENRFEALEEESLEEETCEAIPDMTQQKDKEPLASVSWHQEKEVMDEGTRCPTERKDPAQQLEGSVEGSVTRSRAKASSEDITDTSVEEQEPSSWKGRKSNKVIREQEAAREKAAGKQTNLDFLVKPSQASKYLLSQEEEKKEKEKALKQLRK